MHPLAVPRKVLSTGTPRYNLSLVQHGLTRILAQLWPLFRFLSAIQQDVHVPARDIALSAKDLSIDLSTSSIAKAHRIDPNGRDNAPTE